MLRACGLRRPFRRKWRLAMLKLLSAGVGLFLVVHAMSCGFFFCVRLPGLRPLSSGVYDELRDISVLAGGPLRVERSLYAGEGLPKLIPKIIHQTYKSTRVPDNVKPFMASWRTQNQDWEIRFYDDAACLAFVQREFPEYLHAYVSLPKDVERSDFFRYMVVLRLGGLYADIDCECKQPFNQLIRPRDTMLVSWENEFSSAEEASRRAYVRKRQVLQWVFAAAPGHPALREMCEHIAQAAESMHGQSNRDTLERTGPGPWTDIVLKHARQHPPAARDDPFSVRVLPRVIWGVHPRGLDGMPVQHPSMWVLHHFLGSWKIRSPRDLLRWSVQRRLLLMLWQLFWPRPSTVRPEGELELEMEKALPNDAKGARLYPVSIMWEPPFTMMVHLTGHGSRQAGSDVCDELTRFGAWQPSGSATRGPTVADALIGSLGGQGLQSRVLLDVGAGQGYLALAAAARGHRSLAFEADPVALASLNASLAFNGFQHLVTVHQVALGREEEPVCLDMGTADGALAAGYAHPDAHRLGSGANPCQQLGTRRVGHRYVPSHLEVGGVHVNAPGWEGWVLQGLQELLQRQHPPGVIVVELHPQQLEDNGFDGGAVALLEELYSWGYTDVSHSGHVCDQRWHDITRGIFMRGTAVALPGQPPIKQPTWCRLQPDKFGAVAARVRSPHPENVLLIYRPAGSGFEQELSSGAQGQGLRLAVAEAARQELLPGQPGRT